MTTVLAAVDFEAASARVIAMASNLAAAFGARLVLFNVFPLPELPPNSQVSSDDLDALIVEGQTKARNRLTRLARDAAGVSVEAAFSNDLPSEAICREARQIRAELIVIGSHGHGSFHDLVVGSTAHELLKHAPCPVLIIPALVPEPLSLAVGN